MGMKAIADERELPAPPFNPDTPTAGRLEYIRHLIDPRVLIACRSGECFVRLDGQKWKHAGWTVARNDKGMTEHEIGTAKDDLKVYDYQEQMQSA